MFLNLTSNSLRLSDLDEYGEITMAPRISMVDGVAQVQVFGAQKYAVRVQLDPDKLRAMNVGLNEVASALNRWNVNVPTGTMYGPRAAYNVQVNGQLMNAAAYRPMVVSWHNGVPIRLDEVANVIDSVENDKNASWYYGKDVRAMTSRYAPSSSPSLNSPARTPWR